jgi:hypothetical protein
MRRIKITCGRRTFEAGLLETRTADMVMGALPLHGNTNIWGEEIFFPVPFTAETEDDALEEVEIGSLAYWPPGKAFCIFFGPTPASTSMKPRAYSAVNVFGRILGNPGALREITPGEKIKVDFYDIE